MHTLRHTAPRDWGWLHRAAAPEAAQVFDAGPATPGQARAFTGRVLAEWGLQAAHGDACLVVSELASNAVRESQAAGEPTVLIRFRHTRGTVVVEAGDHGRGRPPRHFSLPADPGRCHGRGLPIVQQYSTARGWYRRGGWKIVWASVPVPAAAAPSAAAPAACQTASVAA